MRNRRSAAGNQNLRREIFDIRRAAGFSSTVSHYRPLWGFHRPPAESLIGNPKYPPAQSICKLRNKCRSRVRKLLASAGLLSAASTKESLDISNLDRIFSAAGRRSNALLKIPLFCRLLEVVGGISALSLEIRIFSRKFKRIAGNPPKSPNFSARAGSCRASAELLNFQLEI